MNDNKKEKFNFFVMFWNGFKNMTLGKTLWTIAVVKLLIMFLVLKPFFFPNFLNSKFNSKEEKSEYVGSQLSSKLINDIEEENEN